MKVDYGKGTTKFGPGVEVELNNYDIHYGYAHRRMIIVPDGNNCWDTAPTCWEFSEYVSAMRGDINDRTCSCAAAGFPSKWAYI